MIMKMRYGKFVTIFQLKIVKFRTLSIVKNVIQDIYFYGENVLNVILKDAYHVNLMNGNGLHNASNVKKECISLNSYKIQASDLLLNKFVLFKEK